MKKLITATLIAMTTLSALPAAASSLDNNWTLEYQHRGSDTWHHAAAHKNGHYSYDVCKSAGRRLFGDKFETVAATVQDRHHSFIQKISKYNWKHASYRYAGTFKCSQPSN